MDYTGYFTYNPANLTLAIPNIAEGMIVVAMGFVLLLIIYYGSLFLSGLALVRADGHELNRKKRVLSDLILMKDIQTDLEKEIEQATLKAAFQDGF